MNGLKISQLVVVRIDAGAEKQARIAPIHDFHAAELDEVRLVLLIARRDQPVDFAFELNLFIILSEGV